MNGDKAYWAGITKPMFMAEEEKWFWVEPNAPSILSIPNFYSDPDGNRVAGKILEDQTSAALYWALRYKMDKTNVYAANRASQHLTKWGILNQEVRGKESKFAMLMEGNKFMDAYLLIDSFNWTHRESFLNWVENIYKLCALEYMGKENNQGAWSWLGFLRSERLAGRNILCWIDGFSDHVKNAIDKNGILYHEVKRTNAGMWYVNFALEPYCQVMFDYFTLHNRDLFYLLEKTLDWYFQYCLHPETWPYKLPTNPFLRWITKLLHPCQDYVELPKPTDWPAHVLEQLVTRRFFEKTEWLNWIQRPVNAGGLNIFKYSTMTWALDLNI